METNKKLPISKLIINFLIGLILGLSISTFAWVNPDQNPPLGGGVIRTDTSGLKIVTTTQITSRLTVSSSSAISIDATGGRIINVALPVANSDVATKEYVDAQSGGGVCYTNYGSSTCATGFTPVLVGYTTLYGAYSYYYDNVYGYGFAWGGVSLACSSITHATSYFPMMYNSVFGSSRNNYLTLLDNEPCVICCK